MFPLSFLLLVDNAPFFLDKPGQSLLTPILFMFSKTVWCHHFPYYFSILDFLDGCDLPFLSPAHLGFNVLCFCLLLRVEAEGTDLSAFFSHGGILCFTLHILICCACIFVSLKYFLILHLSSTLTSIQNNIIQFPSSWGFSRDLSLIGL